MAGDDFYKSDAHHPTPDDVAAMAEHFAPAWGAWKEGAMTPLERAARAMADEMKRAYPLRTSTRKRPRKLLQSAWSLER